MRLTQENTPMASAYHFAHKEMETASLWLGEMSPSYQSFRILHY